MIIWFLFYLLLGITILNFELMKWNCNNIIEFLIVYEQYPLLWNIKNKDYLNLELKDETFKKLYEDLDSEGLVMEIDEKQLEAKTIDSK